VALKTPFMVLGGSTKCPAISTKCGYFIASITVFNDAEQAHGSCGRYSTLWNDHYLDWSEETGQLIFQTFWALGS